MTFDNLAMRVEEYIRNADPMELENLEGYIADFEACLATRVKSYTAQYGWPPEDGDQDDPQPYSVGDTTP